MGGNKASDSSHMLSIHGQSSLCPVSSFKLKTEAAFSTCCGVHEEGEEKRRRAPHASHVIMSGSTLVHPLLAQLTGLTTLGFANQVMALNEESRRTRSRRSHGRHGGGGDIADMAAICGGSRDPRTTPNLLPASAAFPALHELGVNEEEGLEPGLGLGLGLGKW